MASRPGSLGIGAVATLAGLLLAPPIGLADSAIGAVLIEQDFAKAAPGSQPGPWVCFADEGNTVGVVEAPILGGRCLKLARSGGTVWKPMVSGWVMGEGGNTVRLECDWYLPSLSVTGAPVLYVSIRGNVNISVAQVALGGTGGVAVLQDRNRYVPLGFPIEAGQWGRLVMTADPLSRKGAGAFDVTVTQGEEEITCPNLAFQPNYLGDFPSELWHTPMLQVGGGSPEHPHEALLANIRLTVVEPRAYR